MKTVFPLSEDVIAGIYAVKIARQYDIDKYVRGLALPHDENIFWCMNGIKTRIFWNVVTGLYSKINPS